MPLRAGGEAAEQVAAADDDGGLHAELLDLADVLGDLRRDGGVDPELLLAHEGFAGEFQEDATVGGADIGAIISDCIGVRAIRGSTESDLRIAPRSTIASSVELRALAELEPDEARRPRCSRPAWRSPPARSGRS